MTINVDVRWNFKAALLLMLMAGRCSHGAYLWETSTPYIMTTWHFGMEATDLGEWTFDSQEFLSIALVFLGTVYYRHYRSAYSTYVTLDHPVVRSLPASQPLHVCPARYLNIHMGASSQARPRVLAHGFRIRSEFIACEVIGRVVDRPHRKKRTAH